MLFGSNKTDFLSSVSFLFYHALLYSKVILCFLENDISKGGRTSIDKNGILFTLNIRKIARTPTGRETYHTENCHYTNRKVNAIVQ